MNDLMDALVATSGALDAQKKRRNEINEQIFRITEQTHNLIQQIRTLVQCFDEYFILQYEGKYYVIHERTIQEAKRV